MVDIAAFDPGVATGIAHYTEYGEADDIKRIFQSFEIKPKDYPHPHEILFDTISTLVPKRIVYETFDFRSGQMGAVFDGVEYIGVIELYGQTRCLEIIKQTPGYGKSGFWNDHKLKNLGVHKPGKPLANDAMRHLLTLKAKDPDFMRWALEQLREQLHDS